MTGLDYSLRREGLAEELASITRQLARGGAEPVGRPPRPAALDDDASIARSWGAPGGRVGYWIVPDAAVDAEVRRAAIMGREFACAHLGVATPPLRFYRPEGAHESGYRQRYGVADWPSFSAPEQNGHADRRSGTIGVRADIEPVLAAEVASHEVFHLIQPAHDLEAEEQAAGAYGRWASEVLCFGHRDVANVHRHEGFPYRSVLAGVAARGDVLIARDEGKILIVRNFGSRARPDWLPHHAECPVPVPRVNVG